MTGSSREEEARARRTTAELWGEYEARRRETPVRGWLESPVVRRLVQERITGSPEADWLDWAVSTLAVPPGGRWLSLGCGGADAEIRAAVSGRFASMLALDLSETSLDISRGRAREAGIDRIEFRRADLNDLDVPDAEFDVVVAIMSLHHVKELGTTLDRVARALKTGGFFLVNEYVGPSQFQFTDAQLAVAREVLAALPASLRLDVTTGAVKTEYVRRPIAHWNAADPSEAIRSDEIVAELEARFDVVLRRPYGGAVLHLALEHVVHNFHAEDEKDVALLRLAALVEDRLTRSGLLADDFAALALRPKGSGAAAPVVPAPASPLPDPGSLRHDRDRALRMCEQARSELSALEARSDATVAELEARVRGLEGHARGLEARVAEATADREALRLRAEEADATVARLQAFVAAVRGSSGWRALQAIRALVGRKW